MLQTHKSNCSVFLIISYYIIEQAIQCAGAFLFPFFHMRDLNSNSENGSKSRWILRFQPQPFTVRVTKTRAQLEVLMLSSVKCRSAGPHEGTLPNTCMLMAAAAHLSSRRKSDDTIHLPCQVTHNAQRREHSVTQISKLAIRNIWNDEHSVLQSTTPEPSSCLLYVLHGQNAVPTPLPRSEMDTWWLWLSVKLRCFSMPLDPSKGVNANNARFPLLQCPLQHRDGTMFNFPLFVYR